MCRVNIGVITRSTIQEQCDRFFRHVSKGGWPFSTSTHGWPISDCTAEGLKVNPSALMCCLFFINGANILMMYVSRPWPLFTDSILLGCSFTKS